MTTFFLLRVSVFSVRLGSSLKNSGGTLIKVEKVINHPNYVSGSGYDNDISILKLAEEITYSESIQPIKLHPRDADVPNGADTVVSG